VDGRAASIRGIHAPLDEAPSTQAIDDGRDGTSIRERPRRELIERKPIVGSQLLQDEELSRAYPGLGLCPVRREPQRLNDATNRDDRRQR